MIIDDELKIYLPKYLSEQNYDLLIKSLKDFPNNIDSRMYTNYIKDDNIVYQGDIVANFPFAEVDNLEKGKKNCKCIILSNTCDIDLSNKRYFQSRILYAPIIDLDKYKSLLVNGAVEQRKIDDHISSIKNQKISQILFLPGTSQFNDSIVFFDRILNISNKFLDRSKLKDIRLASLSDYGFYLLLFKISVHFSRLQENVQRGF